LIFFLLFLKRVKKNFEFRVQISNKNLNF
jgi:hypothetical protein